MTTIDGGQMHNNEGSALTASIVDRFIAALNNHDATAAAELLTDDAIYIYWHDAEWVTVKGCKAIRALFQEFNNWSSDFQLTRTFAVVTDQSFAVEYSETGTQDLGSNPTGRKFDLRNVMVGELRDNRIIRMTDYSDVTAYRNQMKQ